MARETDLYVWNDGWKKQKESCKQVRREEWELEVVIYSIMRLCKAAQGLS